MYSYYTLFSYYIFLTNNEINTFTNRQISPTKYLIIRTTIGVRRFANFGNWVRFSKQRQSLSRDGTDNRYADITGSAIILSYGLTRAYIYIYTETWRRRDPRARYSFFHAELFFASKWSQLAPFDSEYSAWTPASLGFSTRGEPRS